VPPRGCHARVAAQAACQRGQDLHWHGKRLAYHTRHAARAPRATDLLPSGGPPQRPSAHPGLTRPGRDSTRPARPGPPGRCPQMGRLPIHGQGGLGTRVGTHETLRGHVVSPMLAPDPVLHACPQPRRHTRHPCPRRAWGPPRGPLAAPVVPICRQRARPLAPGRARRGARLPLWCPIPRAAQAPRTAAGLSWRP
jgi:hypothetical protein